MFAPEIVISHPQVDMICIGEGEGPIVDLVERMRVGEGLLRDIKNLWVKTTEREDREESC